MFIQELFFKISRLSLSCIKRALAATPTLIKISKDIHRNSLGAPFLGFSPDD